MTDTDKAHRHAVALFRYGVIAELVRLEPGADLEEAHMRNRQMIAKWVFEKGEEGNVVEQKQKDGKTYFVVNDYDKLRGLFGELLKEVQRVKSEGDFEAAKALVEGVSGLLRDRGMSTLAARAGHNDDALISMGERWGFVRQWELMVLE